MSGNVKLPLRVDRTIGEQLAAGEFARDRRHESSLLSSYWRWDYPEPLDGHFHAGMEVGVVLSGEIEMSFPGAEFTCTPGDVWLCGMWEPHAWRVKYGGSSNLALIFLPELLVQEIQSYPPYFRLFALPPDRRPRATDPRLREFVLHMGRDLHRHTLDRGPLWRAAIRLDLLRILTELGRTSDPSLLSQEQAAARSGSSLARIMPALKLVHERPGRRIAAAAAAAACSLSSSRFQHLFGHAMGVSFGKFCMRVRLALVAHLLRHSDHTVEAIAAETGFVDISHLARAFAKHYGCRPTEYRALGGNSAERPA